MYDESSASKSVLMFRPRIRRCRRFDETESVVLEARSLDARPVVEVERLRASRELADLAAIVGPVGASAARAQGEESHAATVGRSVGRLYIYHDGTHLFEISRASVD